MKRILIVEDDVNLGTPLASILEMQNYTVHYLASGEKVMEELQVFQPDIVLLDVMLNGEQDGFEIGKQIRAAGNLPIIFTTSRDSNEDFKTGFGIENTDYVRKPYKLMEVMLRIDNLLLKQQTITAKPAAFQIGHFSFMPAQQSLEFEYGDIHLNNYETAVLTLLCENTGAFVSRQQVIETVWNEKETKLKEGSLNNILSNLRKYLQKDNNIQLESKTGPGIRLIS